MNKLRKKTKSSEKVNFVLIFCDFNSSCRHGEFSNTFFGDNQYSFFTDDVLQPKIYDFILIFKRATGSLYGKKINWIWC